MGSAPPLARSADAVVVGGGVAGLATAWHLAQYAGAHVVVLEAEPLLASHSSARNAAIYLPLETSHTAVWLAARSRTLLDERLGTGWLRADGVALVAAYEDALDELRFCARQWEVFHEPWGARTLRERLPLLEHSVAEAGIHLPLAGTMDIHQMLGAMAHWARRAGTRICTNAPVAEIERDRGAVCGVRLSDGHRVRTEHVIIAAGAWAKQLGDSAGAELRLTPMRRHLAHLVGGERMPGAQSPAVWRADEQVYYRPETGGVLASPCDEDPWEPSVPPTDPDKLVTLADKLQALAPALAGAGVKSSWACLRTFTPDRELAVGPDPRVRGLHWIAGLGGRGMSCGAAAGEMAARLVRGLGHPLSGALAPARLL